MEKEEEAVDHGLNESDDERSGRGMVIVNVFFCGTSGSIATETTQIGLFANECVAKDLMKDDSENVDWKAGSYKMYFDGCGVTNGMHLSLC
jgi:hypothetical protein